MTPAGYLGNVVFCVLPQGSHQSKERERDHSIQ